MTETNGRRWYDSSRVILTLFGIVAILVGLLYAQAVGQMTKQGDKIADHERRIERMDQKLDDIKSGVDKIERKLDK